VFTPHSVRKSLRSEGIKLTPGRPAAPLDVLEIHEKDRVDTATLVTAR